MQMVGHVPDSYRKFADFTPSSCSHLLKNASIVFGGSETLVDPSDEPGLSHEFVKLGRNSMPMLLSVTNGNLYVAHANACMLLRCGRPYETQTLYDVLALNPKHYTVSLLSAGASLLLKEGDILIVNPATDLFFSANGRSLGPENLEFDSDWYVYACLPEFASANPYTLTVFNKPGVLRDLRLRVEMFFAAWTVQYDLALKGVVFFLDPVREKLYRNEAFSALKTETKRICAPDYDPSESSGEDEVAMGSPVEGACEPGGESFAAVEEEGDNATEPPAAKKAKVDE